MVIECFDNKKSLLLGNIKKYEFKHNNSGL